MKDIYLEFRQWGWLLYKFYMKAQNFSLSPAGFNNLALGKYISYLLDNLILSVKNSFCLSSSGLSREKKRNLFFLKLHSYMKFCLKSFETFIEIVKLANPLENWPRVWVFPFPIL